MYIKFCLVVLLGVCTIWIFTKYVLLSNLVSQMYCMFFFIHLVKYVKKTLITCFFLRYDNIFHFVHHTPVLMLFRSKLFYQ